MSFSLRCRNQEFARSEVFTAFDYLGIERPVHNVQHECYIMDYRLIKRLVDAGELLSFEFAESRRGVVNHRFTAEEVIVLMVLRAIEAEAVDYINSFCCHLDVSLPRNKRRRMIRAHTRKFALTLC